MKRLNQLIAIFIICLCAGLTTVSAQTTEFTYQGKLTDNSMSPTANYDFQFSLYPAASGGTAIGTLQRLGVAVSNGIFTVSLDFGAQFTGAPRYLEIAVRPAGSTGGFQQLLPRQPVTSAPYNIRTLSAANADAATTANNSLQLGGAAANQFVQTSDSRLSDSRNPLAGSASYIQNRSTTQTATSFNIDGTGRADTFNAATQYNLGGNRVLSTDGTNNLFAGAFAGTNNTGSENSFFGRGAGFANTTGYSNSFFGYRAGNSNTTAYNNTFIGFQAGSANTTANSNLFVGAYAGNSNTTGFDNTFMGNGAGSNNTIGYANVFAGSDAGSNNTKGVFNIFIGDGTALANTIGNENTFVGYRAGYQNTTGSDNNFFGIGAGENNTTGYQNVFVGNSAGDNNSTGNSNTVIGELANVGSNNLNHATAVGAEAVVSTSSTITLGRSDGSDTVVVPGKLEIDTLATAGTTQLCLNSSNRVGNCSSSLRYKTNIAPFASGLNLVNKLQPITFNWKADNKADLGLGAEDVAKIEPLLVIYNKAGEVEGVKYDRVAVVLLNAVKEQQTQLEDQQKQIAEQKSMIETLKKLVCAQNANADVCREER